MTLALFQIYFEGIRPYFNKNIYDKRALIYFIRYKLSENKNKKKQLVTNHFVTYNN